MANVGLAREERRKPIFEAYEISVLHVSDWQLSSSQNEKPQHRELLTLTCGFPQTNVSRILLQRRKISR